MAKSAKAKPTSKSKKTKKTTPKAPAVAMPTKTKRLESLRPRRRQRPVFKSSLSGSFSLLRDSFSLFRDRWKLFGGIALVFLLITAMLAGGFGKSISELKDQLMEPGEKEPPGGLATSVLVFGLLIGSSGSSSTEAGGVFRLLTFIIASLAIIWALRQVLASQSVGIRDAFYKGMYPFIPFMLVLLVMGLQLIPVLVSGYLFSLVIGGGLAVSVAEKLVWSGVLFIGGLVSLYMLCSSIFALYIATLPDMRPMQALRSARKLVRFRRWQIMRKIAFLPVALVIIGGLVTIPLILILPPLGQWVFGAVSSISLVIAHTYIFNLYKELL